MAENPRRSAILVHFSGTAFLAAVVLLHFGLVGLGQWLADEYDDFTRLSHDGYAFLWTRIRWSPRPFSESVFWAYGWLVNHSHRPFIGTLLGLLWLGLIAAGLATVWEDSRKRLEDETWPALLVPLALLAWMFASADRVIWVFYWPAAAVAYLPTLAATLLLFLQTSRGRLLDRRGRLLVSSCLLIAACSSEAGAIFVVCYGVLQACAAVVGWIGKRRTPALVVWWVAPLIVAAIILIVVRLNRFHVAEWPGISAGPTKQNVVLSVVAGLRELWTETTQIHGWSHPGRLASQILLAFGVGLSWSRYGRLSRDTTQQILVTVAALICAALGTIVSAYYHFGFLCCDQHYLLRQCWIVISFAGIGILFSSWLGRRLLSRVIASAVAQVVLCAAVLSQWHVRPLLRTYQVYGLVRHATAQNFEAGYKPSDEMNFRALPETLIAQPRLSPGLHVQDPAELTDVQYILRFFNKKRIVVVEPLEPETGGTK